MAATSAQDSVRAWDLPTRLFHWTLVALIANAWLTFEYSEALGDNVLKWHRINGYAILILLVFRLLWGVWGSSTSRFYNFVRGPRQVLGYARALLRGEDRHYLGHNPLGTGMILLLLGLLLTQAVFGLFTLEHDETVAGPLKRFASDPTVAFMSWWHRRGFNIILGFVAVHVLANLGYAVFKRDPLIRAMVTGTKPRERFEDAAEASIVSHPLLRALLTLFFSAAVILGGILALGGKLL